MVYQRGQKLRYRSTDKKIVGGPTNNTGVPIILSVHRQFYRSTDKFYRWTVKFYRSTGKNTGGPIKFNGPPTTVCDPDTVLQLTVLDIIINCTLLFHSWHRYTPKRKIVDMIFVFYKLQFIPIQIIIVR